MVTSGPTAELQASKAASTPNLGRVSRSDLPANHPQRRRSRSPSHYLRKSGRSIKGMLSKNDKSKKVKSPPAKPAAVTTPATGTQVSKDATDSTRRTSTVKSAASTAAGTIEDGEAMYKVVVDSLNVPETEKSTAIQKTTTATQTSPKKNEKAAEKQQDPSGVKPAEKAAQPTTKTVDEKKETKTDIKADKTVSKSETKKEGEGKKTETKADDSAKPTKDAAKKEKVADKTDQMKSTEKGEEVKKTEQKVNTPPTKTKKASTSPTQSTTKTTASAPKPISKPYAPKPYAPKPPVVEPFPASVAANPQDQDKKDTSMLKRTMELLLLEPKTRRFELLQLEFNPDKALVQDILSQVAVTATEDTLRKQKYVGICGVNGKEIEQGNLLRDYVEAENEVALAIPAGIEPRDVAKLAYPILQDPKIKSMFKSSLEKLDLFPMEEIRVKEKSRKPRGSVAEEEKIASVLAGDGKDQTETPSSQQSGLPFIANVLLVTALVGLAVLLHSALSKPLRPGDSLAAGEWRTKCGILSIIPSKYSFCDDVSVELGEDGVLTAYDSGSFLDSDRAIIWKMEASEGALEILEDGSLTIGGKQPTLQMHPDYMVGDLSPWPFEAEVKGKASKRRVLK